MIVVVWLQYEMCYFTRSSICTASFHLINSYLFTDDVELVNLNNLEVLILQGNGLNGSLPFKAKHSIIYFNCGNNFHMICKFFSYKPMSHFKYFLLTLSTSILFVDMANFSSLKILDLSENSFTGCIPPYIGALSSLKAPSLYSNKLNRTLPIRGKNLL